MPSAPPPKRTPLIAAGTASWAGGDPFPSGHPRPTSLAATPELCQAWDGGGMTYIFFPSLLTTDLPPPPAAGWVALPDGHMQKSRRGDLGARLPLRASPAALEHPAGTCPGNCLPSAGNWARCCACLSARRAWREEGSGELFRGVYCQRIGRAPGERLCRCVSTLTLGVGRAPGSWLVPVHFAWHRRRRGTGTAASPSITFHPFGRGSRLSLPAVASWRGAEAKCWLDLPLPAWQRPSQNPALPPPARKAGDSQLPSPSHVPTPPVCTVL